MQRNRFISIHDIGAIHIEIHQEVIIGIGSQIGFDFNTSGCSCRRHGLAGNETVFQAVLISAERLFRAHAKVGAHAVSNGEVGRHTVLEGVHQLVDTAESRAELDWLAPIGAWELGSYLIESALLEVQTGNAHVVIVVRADILGQSQPLCLARLLVFKVDILNQVVIPSHADVGFSDISRIHGQACGCIASGSESFCRPAAVGKVTVVAVNVFRPHSSIIGGAGRKVRQRKIHVVGGYVGCRREIAVGGVFHFENRVITDDVPRQVCRVVSDIKSGEGIRGSGIKNHIDIVDIPCSRVIGSAL